jgi:alpha-tubulin suppressor-like RCC1 family protein
MNRLTQLLTAFAVAALVGLSAPLPASAAPDPSLGVLKVSAGGSYSYGALHTCAILSDHSMWCWGANVWGQLGDPALTTQYSEPTMRPNKVVGNHQWESFDTGDGHTCAIDTIGALWCWGSNTYGQLGTNEQNYGANATPLRVGIDSDWVGVTALDTHTCAIKRAGSVWCWGYGDTRLGLGPGVPDQHAPARVGTDSDWAFVDAGYKHTCATKTGGALWCWGEIILGSPLENPTRIGTSTNSGWVGAGAYAACVISTDAAHALSCFGENGFGQGGSNSTSFLTVLTQVQGGGSWISAGLGQEHTCGVQANHSLWCWGRNNYGQLATDGADSLVPHAAGTDRQWAAVDSGPYHSCAITTGRDLYCWGLNNTGQLGDGSTTDRNQPVLVIDGAEAPPTPELPSTAAESNVQRAEVLAQLALLAVVCAFALRMSRSNEKARGARRR